MTAQELIAKLEVLEKVPLSNAEFSRRSNAVFEPWTKDTPNWEEIIRIENAAWYAAYSKRVAERIKYRIVNGFYLEGL